MAGYKRPKDRIPGDMEMLRAMAGAAVIAPMLPLLLRMFAPSEPKPKIEAKKGRRIDKKEFDECMKLLTEK